MKDLTKKVMILNSFASPYISEAIIILKDYDPRFETKAIAEAEKIVNDYLGKKTGTRSTEKGRHPALRLCTALILMAICFAAGMIVGK